jgi:dTDP-4-dehydrorhamnose 3,5-epimerase
MKVTETFIKGLFVIEPDVYLDTRGYFFESYNKKNLLEHHIDFTFIQDNESKSNYGVIRGLHFQLPPFAQTKLVRVLKGSIWDVAVDIREGSSTYGKWFGIELSGENHKQLLIPQGFAHGFSVLSDEAVVFYKCDQFYNRDAERGIIYNDSSLNIDWKINVNEAIISEKDKKLPLFEKAELIFKA